MEERRSKERFSVWFPLTVITDDGEEGTAITFDVSAAGLLIVVGVVVDTMRQLEAQLLMRHYEGFIK